MKNYYRKNILVVSLTIAFFVFLAWIVGGYSSGYSESEIGSIGSDELTTLSAEDFIYKLKQYRIFEIHLTNKNLPNDSIPKDTAGVYITGWPRKEDIPYLLKVSNDKTPCGIIWLPLSSYLPRRNKTYSEVGTVSLSMLKSLKYGKFHIHEPMSEMPESEREEIIKWAKSQVRLEQTD